MELKKNIFNAFLRNKKSFETILRKVYTKVIKIKNNISINLRIESQNKSKYKIDDLMFEK